MWACAQHTYWGVSDGGSTTSHRYRVRVIGQPIVEEVIFSMAKVSAFHSKLPGTTKYHDNNQCTEGNNIESSNRVSGTGGFKKCDHCGRLD